MLEFQKRRIMFLLAYDTPTNAYGPAIDQLRPYKGTLSGEKEHQKPSYNYGPPSTKYPILALEDDIIGQDGRGLKKGFYEVRIDSENKFLLFVQSGNLKAKIPVIFYETSEKKEEKPQEGKILDKKIAKQMRKEAKKAKKEAYKYRKGENPKNIVFSSVKMTYDEKNSCWVINWELDSSRAIGCFRI